MKLDTKILDEIIVKAPLTEPDFIFCISKEYTKYPKKYKGFSILKSYLIDGNTIYFGLL
jgi:hypothetical protein